MYEKTKMDQFNGHEASQITTNATKRAKINGISWIKMYFLMCGCIVLLKL